MDKGVESLADDAALDPRLAEPFERVFFTFLEPEALGVGARLRRRIRTGIQCRWNHNWIIYTQTD